MTASLTAGLVAHVRGKSVTPDDLHAAALFTLDALANAIAGRISEPGEILRNWADANSGDDGREAFRIGALTHILETDDLHRASVVHPGCVVVPAVAALARHTLADGRKLLTAVLWGFEAACRVGMAVGPAHYRIWHNTATCGPFGAAMAVANLLDLSPGQTVDALGNAGTQSSGLWQFLATGAMSKHLHAGRAAESGVMAAGLAAVGFTGPPEILEGERGMFRAMCPDPDPSRVLASPDAPWQLRLTSIKPWPSCRHTHPSIDAARELRQALDGETIRAVTVRTYRASLDVCDRPVPRTAYEAKFSLQHNVAAALALPAVDFDAFEASARKTLAGMRERISVSAEPEWTDAYPVAWGAVVEVQTESGRTVRALRHHAKGDPEAPLSDDEMIAKAHMLLAHGGLDRAEADRFVAAVLAMAQGGPMPPVPR